MCWRRTKMIFKFWSVLAPHRTWSSSSTRETEGTEEFFNIVRCGESTRVDKECIKREHSTQNAHNERKDQKNVMTSISDIWRRRQFYFFPHYLSTFSLVTRSIFRFMRLGGLLSFVVCRRRRHLFNCVRWETFPTTMWGKLVSNYPWNVYIVAHTLYVYVYIACAMDTECVSSDMPTLCFRTKYCDSRFALLANCNGYVNIECYGQMDFC